MKGTSDRSQAIQRVKVGMIGLAVVVLLIGLASAIMRTVTREPPVTTVGAPKAEVVANMSGGSSAKSEGSEPLAELGVAPAVANDQAAATHQSK